jgi:hypothetical protein
MDHPIDAPSGESYPTIMQVDSNLDVTHKLTAPTTFLGDEICNIELRSDSEHGERLLITLPTTGKGQTESGQTQTYDMRSIIESIQELNRRTATFNCNVSFNAALEAYDVSQSPNLNFACDLDEDGLPAATNGGGNIPALTEENKYRVLLCINHEPIENLHEDTGLVIDLTGMDKKDIDVSNDAAVQEYIANYNTNNEDKIIYIEAYPNIHTYDETTRTVVIKVLTSGYFKNANRPWEYVYRTWNVPAEGSIDKDLNINYTVLSARYNFNRSDTYYKGDRFKSPMTSMFRIGELRSDSVGFPTDEDQTNIVYITECVYQFSPQTISTDGNYTQTVLTNIALKNIDLAYHDVSRVTNMYGMFHKNYVLTEIQIPETFDTSSVITFHSMFRECSAIKELSLPKSFDTSNAVSLYGMFMKTRQLSTITFNTDFNTGNAKILKHLFYCCGFRGLLNLPLKFTAKSAKSTGIDGLFAHMVNCDSIIFPPEFEVGPDVTSCWEVFGYSGFRYLTIPASFINSNVTSFKYLFANNSSLTQLFFPNNLDLSQSDISWCLNNTSSLSLLYTGNTKNTALLKDTNNTTGLILDNSWNTLSSTLYTRNSRRFVINCDMYGMVDSNNSFSDTIDTTYHPIRPGCRVKMDGQIAPKLTPSLSTITITLNDIDMTYNTSFDLRNLGVEGTLPITISFSDGYRSMTVTSKAALYNNELWYISWIYTIMIDYTDSL